MSNGPDKPWWLQLISGGETTKRFVLFLLIGALAALLGFVAVDMWLCSFLVAFGGYYFILAVFGAFLWQAWKLAEEHRSDLLRGLRNPGLPGLCILAGSLFLIFTDGFGHKVLWDEYVLQSTAEHLHRSKEIGAAYRGFQIEGSWISFDIFLDKRPYFFAFLVSLVHDLTGYRPANMLVVNAGLVPLLLTLAYFLAKKLSDRRGGMFAVLLLSTLPILVQNASGAGMEVHNLTMLCLEVIAGAWYLAKPDERRLSFLCLCTVLLSQSRYESVIFTLPAGMVILAGWHKAGRPLLPWTFLLLPLLYMPYAWHNRVLTANPILWQLHEGQSVRFSTNYLLGNLEGLRIFFLSEVRELANSVFVAALGLLSVFFLLVRIWKTQRKTPLGALPAAPLSVCLFSLGVVANLTLMMLYYWGRFDDPVASRFSLPSYFFLVLAGVAGVHALSELWRPARYVCLGAFGLYLAAIGMPKLHSKLYTEYNLSARVQEWELSELQRLPRLPRLLLCNRSNLPFMLEHMPAVGVDAAVKHGERILYHLNQGTFQEVLVLHRLRATSEKGEFGPDPEDVIPDGFVLERLTERRFGATLHRISRVVRINPDRIKPTFIKKAHRDGTHATLGH